jgi:pimeloyl-ACP methyl ester carboxylesterase
VTSPAPEPALPPVALIHGFAGSTERTWAPAGWLDLLADFGRDVVAIDLLGHGTAPKPHDPEAYTALEDLARDALPAECCDGVGFSLGARVLLDLAAAEPHRFRRLVVSGVGANLFQTERDETLADFLSIDDPGEAPPTARYFLAQMTGSDADPKALAAYLRRPARGPFTAEQLARVDLPVLVVLGDQDFAGPADPLMDALPDARLVTLPGVDHFATPKQFAFLDAALDFLAEP